MWSGGREGGEEGAGLRVSGAIMGLRGDIAIKSRRKEVG